MSKSVTREITLNGKKVSYTLEFKNVKNINIHITPEKGFYISAPPNVDINTLEKRLKVKSNVILDAIEKCEKIRNGADPKTMPKAGINERTIILNGKKVEYTLQFKQVKKITLSISIDKGVRISAPNRAAIADIEKFMQNNADFIISTLEKYKKISDNLPKPKKYVNGEYIYFLGEKKKLSVVQSAHSFVEINGDEIRLFVTDTENFDLKEFVIDDFLKKECEKYVLKLCRELYPKFKKKGIAFPQEIRFKKMISCWGNCRPTRSILTFSTYLIQLPPKCIEATVCHEFTHFLHNNHSKAFYAQLTEFMPDWKTYDQIMKDLQNEIIIRNK